MRGRGVWFPAHEAIFPEPMRHALFRAIQHYMASMPSIYRVETYSGFTRTVKDHGELNRRLNSPGFPRILYEIPGNPAHLSKDAHGEICWIGYGGVVHNNRKSLARLLLGDCDVGFYDGNFLGNPFCLDVIPTTFPDLALYQGIRQLALYIGMPSHELEQLIEWELQPLSPKEKTALADMVTLFVNKETDKPYYEKHSSQVYNHCAAMIGNRVPRGAFVPGKATNQIDWQMEELIFFISLCLRDTPHWLAESPVKIPSGKYVETLRVERTQQDLINEMAIELSSLPPYTAYAKIIDEQSGTQRVLKHKIHTYPLPQPVRGMEIEQRLIENSHALSLERERIEAEIRQRQERWINIYRPRTPEPPPASEPPPDVPPTRF